MKWIFAILYIIFSVIILFILRSIHVDTTFLVIISTLLLMVSILIRKKILGG